MDLETMTFNTEELIFIGLVIGAVIIILTIALNNLRKDRNPKETEEKEEPEKKPKLKEKSFSFAKNRRMRELEKLIPEKKLSKKPTMTEMKFEDTKGTLWEPEKSIEKKYNEAQKRLEETIKHAEESKPTRYPKETPKKMMEEITIKKNALFENTEERQKHEDKLVKKILESEEDELEKISKAIEPQKTKDMEKEKAEVLSSLKKEFLELNKTEKKDLWKDSSEKKEPILTEIQKEIKESPKETKKGIFSSPTKIEPIKETQIKQPIKQPFLEKKVEEKTKEEEILPKKKDEIEKPKRIKPETEKPKKKKKGLLVKLGIKKPEFSDSEEEQMEKIMKVLKGKKAEYSKDDMIEAMQNLGYKEKMIKEVIKRIFRW